MSGFVLMTPDGTPAQGDDQTGVTGRAIAELGDRGGPPGPTVATYHAAAGFRAGRIFMLAIVLALEGFRAIACGSSRFFLMNLEAPPGFEPGVEVLQA